MYCPNCHKDYESVDGKCPSCGEKGLEAFSVPLEGGVDMKPQGEGISPVRIESSQNVGTMPGGNMPFKEFVPNHMGLSITSLVVAFVACCFTFFLIFPPVVSFTLSIIAVVYSGQVDKRTALGDNEGARKSAVTAQVLGWIVITFNFLLLVGMIVIVLTGGREVLLSYVKALFARLGVLPSI